MSDVQAVLLQHLRAQRQKIDAAIAAIVALNGDAGPVRIARPAGQPGLPRRGYVGQMLEIVNAHPEGIRCVDVVRQIGKTAEQTNIYLRRLLRDGDIEQYERGGKYFPRATSIESSPPALAAVPSSSTTSTTDTHE